MNNFYIALHYLKDSLFSKFMMLTDNLGLTLPQDREKITDFKKKYLEALKTKKRIYIEENNAEKNNKMSDEVFIIFSKINDDLRNKLLEKNIDLEKHDINFFSNQILLSELLNEIINQIQPDNSVDNPEYNQNKSLAIQNFLKYRGIAFLYPKEICIYLKSLSIKIFDYYNQLDQIRNNQNLLEYKTYAIIADIEDYSEKIPNMIAELTKVSTIHKIEDNNFRNLINNAVFLETDYLRNLIKKQDGSNNIDSKYDERIYKIMLQEEGIYVAILAFQEKLDLYKSLYEKKALYEYITNKCFDLEIYIEELSQILENQLICSIQSRTLKQKFIDLVPDFNIEEMVKSELEQSNFMNRQDFMLRLGNIDQLYQIYDAKYNKNAYVNKCNFQKISKELVDEAKNVFLS